MAEQAVGSQHRRLIGCIEGGGTKWNLAVARTHDDVLETARVATSDPAETIGAAIAFFLRAAQVHGPIAAIGIGSFGPVDVRSGSQTWGHILPTPKPGWTGADIVTPLQAALGCPVGLDTDVNAAVLAESLWGAAQGCTSAVYVTVGTGIGGGVLLDGRLVHGFRHPEMGHVLVRRHADDLEFAGICPFHGDCLEGLASGPAIQARWGQSLSDLAQDHSGPSIIANYLAQLAVMQLALFSCERIVIGGGVLATPGIMPLIRGETRRLANDYFGPYDYDTLIVAPGLGDRSGVLGAFALGQRAFEAARTG